MKQLSAALIGLALTISGLIPPGEHNCDRLTAPSTSETEGHMGHHGGADTSGETESHECYCVGPACCFTAVAPLVAAGIQVVQTEELVSPASLFRAVYLPAKLDRTYLLPFSQAPPA